MDKLSTTAGRERFNAVTQSIGLHDPAVAWGAIIAGAMATTATMTLLLILGAGVGLSSISPWFGVGASTAVVGASAVIWLIACQWISAGLGGFLAGRLRSKWEGLHDHEVFFRDTAHGLLVWSLATVAGAALFALTTVAGVTGFGKAAADAAAVVAGHADGSGGATNYFTDTLFRAEPVNGDDESKARDQAIRIIDSSIVDGQIVLSAPDSAYLVQLVAAKTSLSQNDAEQRIDAVVRQLNDAKQKILTAADIARKRAAQISIVTALSLLIGAFVASAAAALGGHMRSESTPAEQPAGPRSS